MSGMITDLYEAPALTVEGVIHECTQIIERNETVAGAGRRMLNPMLSVFLGKNAVEHINEIQEAYYSCWSDHAKHLKVLRGAYTLQDIENAIFQATQVEDRSLDTQNVRTVWFWDIMDDGFDTYFECVQQQYKMPVGTGNHRVYFVFCSQRDSMSQEKTQQRLTEKLIPWAQQTQSALVVLSDTTSRGILKASGVAENYRLAANLMLIMNSHYSSYEDDLGKFMTFEINKGGVFTGSYHGCSKNFFDIVGVSLLTIIKKYRDLGKQKSEDYSYSNSVQNRLCGSNRSYFDLISDIFEKTLQSSCKADARLWQDMPKTEALQSLRQQLAGAQEKQGFFSRLLGGAKRTVSAGEAIASLDDFWKCCLKRYYIGPVEAYLNSDEGRQAIKDHMYSRMTAVLNYDEMHELLSKESRQVVAVADAVETGFPVPMTERFNNADELLHAHALRQVKLAVAKRLLLWLSEAMADLCANAAGFDELLEAVQFSLREEHMEHSVVRAYGSHMEQLLEQRPDLLTRYIRPSKDESELLRQLQETFSELVSTDTKRVYQKSLQGDLQFRIDNGGAADAVDVIANCFKFDMFGACRLPMLKAPEGTLYCIMNNAMDNLGDTIPSDSIGNRFIINRSDRIERLCLFQVQPESIMFSNEM